MGAFDIDYSPRPYQPSGLSRGMSHLSTVLDALLERKSQEERLKAQLAQQRELAMVDDARLQGQANEQMSYHQAELEQKRAELEAKSQDQQYGRTEKAMPGILQALKDRDPTAAQMWAQLGGGSVTEAPRTTVPENAVGDMLAPKPAGPDLSALPGPFGLLGVAQQARQRAQAPQGPLKYRVQMPGGQAVDYDPEEERRARLQQGGQLAGDLSAVAGNSPHDQRAVADVERMAKTGAFKTRDEVLQAFLKQKNFYEEQANAETRARIAAAAQGSRVDRAHPPGERIVPNYEGKPAGEAATKEEADATRKKRATLRPIVAQLDQLDQLVGGMGWKERAPIIGQFTEAQQRAKGMLDTMIAPITQVLGSGTPQEAEARRKLDTLTANIGQGPKVAKQNIAALKAFLLDSFEQQLGSVVPGYQPRAAPAPTARSLADEILGGP